MPVFLCLAAADSALTAHASSLESFMADYGAIAFDWTPTTLCALFLQDNALNCALALHSYLSPDTAHLGMALHIGPYERLGRLSLGAGPTRSRHVARVAWDQQILLTQEYVAVVGLPPVAATKALGVHFITDLAQPAPLYQLLHPDLKVEDFPPLRSLSYYPNNLRVQTTAFVGRSRELRELVTQLQSPERRLMTLTGPGGIGKTRLALQIAAEVIRDFPQGAFFIPCEAISAGGLLPSTIAQALHLPFSDRLDPQTQLLNQLRRCTLLLVLDNYESLLPDTTLLTEILVRTPRVNILLTSREPLGLPGEHVCPLDGLAFPRRNHPEDVVIFETFDAVQLFFLAALRADPLFVLAEGTRDAVIAICELVDGLPLALELAATWVRMFSCEEIMWQITRGLDFLQATRRDLSVRHRSLRAVFETTRRQLSPAEQAVFAQCALFHGSFSEAAAHIVAAATPSALSSLVHKSMLMQTASQRYKLHPLLRHYATEQLTVTPDLFAAFEERHGLY